MDLNFQYAHHSHEESETRRAVDAREALEAFDQFDWSMEVKKAKELQKCSPTLTVKVNGDEEMVWVSGFGEADSAQFVSECYFPGEIKRLFGLLKTQGTINLSSQSFSKSQARQAIKLLLAKDYQALRDLYA